MPKLPPPKLPNNSVDVVDGKIPEKIPENGVSGEAGLRLSSGNLEKLTSAGINIGLGNNFVLHTEGLYRKSGDYAVPRYQKEEGRLKRLPDSHADSKTGSIGLSWVGEKALSARRTATVATAMFTRPQSSLRRLPRRHHLAEKFD